MLKTRGDYGEQSSSSEWVKKQRRRVLRATEGSQRVVKLFPVEVMCWAYANYTTQPSGALDYQGYANRRNETMREEGERDSIRPLSLYSRGVLSAVTLRTGERIKKMRINASARLNPDCGSRSSCEG
ncbi:hypothetical protein E2C01_012033 [Portunus trituberculatus]|uniref:Uncharacterized protein n=1 Tax=Portunus trituberculatus TaxID=210409 RepID=A0A5B7DDI9_PORTR|nr:hypothetical protein [Portunus trituberculatus]